MVYDPIIKHLGIASYISVMDDMKSYTKNRTPDSSDQIWCVEHPPVFTQGRHGKPEHIIAKDHNIPIVQSDRGGQITYHGPKQAIIYFMIDLKRAKSGIKQLVCDIEASTIKLMRSYNLDAHLIDGSPGVYIKNKKIASLGLRVKHGKTYHGLSINVDMNLIPFSHINPCGYAGLEVCNMSDFIKEITVNEVFNKYISVFIST
jgi:lipoyl(octanoyl) transferase